MRQYLSDFLNAMIRFSNSGGNETVRRTISVIFPFPPSFILCLWFGGVLNISSVVYFVNSFLKKSGNFLGIVVYWCKMKMKGGHDNDRKT